MDQDVKYDLYWNILKQNHEMIRFSEVKAGFIVSINGIVFTMLFQHVQLIKSSIEENVFILFITVVFLLCTIMSFLYSFMCFIPRFENKNPTSVIYFGDIVSDFDHYSGYHQFLRKIINSEDEMDLQLAEQIHTNAAIATKKFRFVSKSIRLLLVSILLLMILLGTIILF